MKHRQVNMSRDKIHIIKLTKILRLEVQISNMPHRQFFDKKTVLLNIVWQVVPEGESENSVEARAKSHYSLVA